MCLSCLTFGPKQLENHVFTIVTCFDSSVEWLIYHVGAGTPSVVLEDFGVLNSDSPRMELHIVAGFEK